MATRLPGRALRIGLPFVALALVFLTSGVCRASEIEREIPLVQDGAGNGITLEISREGDRQIATPRFFLSDAAGGSVAKRLDRQVAGRADREKVALPEIAAPEEITARNVKSLFKALRSSLKEKQARTTASDVSTPEPVRVASQQ